MRVSAGSPRRRGSRPMRSVNAAGGGAIRRLARCTPMQEHEPDPVDHRKDQPVPTTPPDKRPPEEIDDPPPDQMPPPKTA